MTGELRLAEPCMPPVGTILQHLSRDELENIAARFWGHDPRRFEEILLGDIQPLRDRMAGWQATP